MNAGPSSGCAPRATLSLGRPPDGPDTVSQSCLVSQEALGVREMAGWRSGWTGSSTGAPLCTLPTWDPKSARLPLPTGSSRQLCSSREFPLGSLQGLSRNSCWFCSGSSCSGSSLKTTSRRMGLKTQGELGAVSKEFSAPTAQQNHSPPPTLKFSFDRPQIGPGT